MIKPCKQVNGASAVASLKKAQNKQDSKSIFNPLAAAQRKSKSTRNHAAKRLMEATTVRDQDGHRQGPLPHANRSQIRVDSTQAAFIQTHPSTEASSFTTSPAAQGKHNTETFLLTEKKAISNGTVLHNNYRAAVFFFFFL